MLLPVISIFLLIFNQPTGRHVASFGRCGRNIKTDFNVDQTTKSVRVGSGRLGRRLSGGGGSLGETVSENRLLSFTTCGRR